MYDSKPKDREGEPIEFVVPEAINSTASRGRQNVPGGHLPLPDWVPESKAAFAAVSAIAVLEAFVIVLMVTL